MRGVKVRLCLARSSIDGWFTGYLGNRLCHLAKEREYRERTARVDEVLQPRVSTGTGSRCDVNEQNGLLARSWGRLTPPGAKCAAGAIARVGVSSSGSWKKIA